MKKIETFGDFQQKKEDKALSKIINTRVLEGLVIDGLVDVKGKDKETIRREIKKTFGKNLKNLKFQIVIDHTSSILAQARKFYKNKKYEFSFLFYATWFEHWVNKMIHDFSIRNEFEEKFIYEILKRFQLGQKTDFVFRFLKIKPILKKHLKVANRIVELRNEFVHYKWKFGPDEWDDEGEENGYEKDIEKMEKTIEFLKRYERKEIFDEKLNIIREIAREGLNEEK